MKYLTILFFHKYLCGRLRLGSLFLQASGSPTVQGWLANSVLSKYIWESETNRIDHQFWGAWDSLVTDITFMGSFSCWQPDGEKMRSIVVAVSLLDHPGIFFPPFLSGKALRLVCFFTTQLLAGLQYILKCWDVSLSVFPIWYWIYRKLDISAMNQWDIKLSDIKNRILAPEGLEEIWQKKVACGFKAKPDDKNNYILRNVSKNLNP